MSTNCVSEYVLVVNLKVDGIEAEGGRETQDGFPEEGVDATLDSRVLVEEGYHHVAEYQSHKGILSGLHVIKSLSGPGCGTTCLSVRCSIFAYRAPGSAFASISATLHTYGRIEATISGQQQTPQPGKNTVYTSDVS
jgi:hypothetical protein